MDDITYWLGLHHALGNTPRTIYRLLKKFNSPRTIMDLYKKDPRRFPLTDIQHQRMRTFAWSAIDRDINWQTQQPHHHILTIHDPRYPQYLREIHAPPLILYISGNPSMLSQPQLAIVGSRNPTPSGRNLAHTFAVQLSHAGLTITSGLAIGIDGCAHQGALQSNAATIAVLGCGADIIYPLRHRKLAQQIIEQGAIISEFPVGSPSLPANFPKRNRIISGLSMGTLVIEATLRSGSLITAHAANNQGREVFAIPSSIHNPLARGCHQLIKNGAKLVENVEDILTELNLKLKTTPQIPTQAPLHEPSKGLDKTDRKLLECVGFEVRSVQEMSALLNVATQNISARLLKLELHGYIKAVPGGYYRVT